MFPVECKAKSRLATRFGLHMGLRPPFAFVQTTRYFGRNRSNQHEEIGGTGVPPGTSCLPYHFTNIYIPKHILLIELISAEMILPSRDIKYDNYSIFSKIKLRDCFILDNSVVR